MTDAGGRGRSMTNAYGCGSAGTTPCDEALLSPGRSFAARFTRWCRSSSRASRSVLAAASLWPGWAGVFVLVLGRESALDRGSGSHHRGTGSTEGAQRDWPERSRGAADGRGDRRRDRGTAAMPAPAQLDLQDGGRGPVLGERRALLCGSAALRENRSPMRGQTCCRRGVDGPPPTIGPVNRSRSSRSQLPADPPPPTRPAAVQDRRSGAGAPGDLVRGPAR